MLLTKPPVEKLLPDRPPLPPGAAYPKTLVINLRGTLIHSEYKVIKIGNIIAYIVGSWFRNIEKTWSECIYSENE